MSKGENILKLVGLVGSVIMSAVALVSDGKELPNVIKDIKKEKIGKSGT